jgi:hypothetical protein
MQAWLVYIFREKLEVIGRNQPLGFSEQVKFIARLFRINLPEPVEVGYIRPVWFGQALFPSVFRPAKLLIYISNSYNPNF